ncbi:MAG TPA: hypothetical protein VGB38_04090, partial [bacterium]
DKSSLRSGFGYTQAFLHVARHQPTFATGYLNIDLRAGTSIGGLPVQRFFRLPGNTNPLTRFGAFRTLQAQEAGGERMASFWAEHHFGSLPFKALRLPWFRHRNLDFILLGGAGWAGNDSEANTEPEGLTPMEQPVYEAGFGIGRWFGMLRLDFVWRVSETGLEHLAVAMDVSY